MRVDASQGRRIEIIAHSGLTPASGVSMRQPGPIRRAGDASRNTRRRLGVALYRSCDRDSSRGRTKTGPGRVREMFSAIDTADINGFMSWLSGTYLFDERSFSFSRSKKPRFNRMALAMPKTDAAENAA